ncbi:THO complex subunit 6 [Citrus sinensis]|uniref:THO complex subunit 6 n=1 Tax=Citrus sinensis TaxID=2711 RepID=A0ACB8NTH4_CITSI|nr:THO complex subunit 6 [Citrus sinensis]KAH9801527.1 THO complex subunit 6 [Citrus sinensis]
MCGDSTNWDEDAYRKSILKEREILTRTVFRTVWGPSKDGSPDTIVIASSDGSITSYSIPSCISKLPLGLSNSKVQQLLGIEPDGFLHGHDGPAYDVKFYGGNEDALLLSCGDDGRICGWRWKEFTESKVPINLQGNHVKPVLDLVNHQHKILQNLSTDPSSKNPNISEIKPLNSHPRLLHAVLAGSVATYKLNGCRLGRRRHTAETLTTGQLAGFLSKRLAGGPWGALSPVPENNAIAVDPQIVTGSEDGTARIWDCKSGKCIKVIDPVKDKQLKGVISCVSCITLDASESWLACGSGQNLSVWNLPTSECVSTISSHSPIQDVVFDNNQVISVGGYGGLVDVISQFGSHLCTFCCQGL